MIRPQGSRGGAWGRIGTGGCRPSGSDQAQAVADLGLVSGALETGRAVESTWPLPRHGLLYQGEGGGV
jgi:hypothetical protein